MSWTGRTIPTASWGNRTEPSTSWDGRFVPGENCMDVIITGLWDDSQVWQDTKIWLDNGGSQYTWPNRVIPS